MSSHTTHGISGTQSPPLSDSEPMGASSIRGGNAGGIPDREQRAQYFDEQQPQPEKNVWETSATASDPARHATDSQNSAEHGQPRSLWETGAAATGPFKEMDSDQIRGIMHEGTVQNK